MSHFLKLKKRENEKRNKCSVSYKHFFLSTVRVAFCYVLNLRYRDNSIKTYKFKPSFQPRTKANNNNKQKQNQIKPITTNNNNNNKRSARFHQGPFYRAYAFVDIQMCRNPFYFYVKKIYDFKTSNELTITHGNVFLIPIERRHTHLEQMKFTWPMGESLLACIIEGILHFENCKTSGLQNRLWVHTFFVKNCVFNPHHRKKSI